MNIVYINGQFVEKSQASVSIMDRGFLFADGAYEVIPYINNTAIGLEAHLQRLEKSLQAIYIPCTCTKETWKDIFQELIKLNSLAGASFSIYLQVTRGASDIRAHAFPDKIEPTVIAFCTPAKKQLESYSNLKAITLLDERHAPCYIKSTNLLVNVLAYNKALQQGAVEAILHDGTHITEGTSSSIFIVKNNIIATPSLCDHILPSITRSILIDIFNQNNIAFEERKISINELNEVDEIWVSSSTKPIYPISKLNNTTVGSGEPGPVWRKTIALYNRHNSGETV